MSSQVTTATIQSYTNMASHLLQQKGSKLKKHIWQKSFTGKAAKAVEQIGKVEARKKTVRHSDQDIIETPHAARWIHPDMYYLNDLIDSDDKLKMLIDATSAYAESQMYGMGRKVDSVICDALLGTAYTGENGTTTTAFDTANQQIALGGAGMTFSKIRDTKKILMDNDWDDENDPVFLLIASQQYDDMMGLTEVTSGDFTKDFVLKDGKLQSFYGFNIIRLSNDILPTDSNGDRRCIAFAKSGLCYGEWDGLKARVDERSDKHYATQVYTSLMMGATRTEEGKVVEILCDE